MSVDLVIRIIGSSGGYSVMHGVSCDTIIFSRKYFFSAA